MATEEDKWLLWISGEHAVSILTLMFTKPRVKEASGLDSGCCLFSHQVDLL